MEVSVHVSFSPQDLFDLVKEKMTTQGLIIKPGTMQHIEGRNGEFAGIKLEATMPFAKLKGPYGSTSA